MKLKHNQVEDWHQKYSKALAKGLKLRLKQEKADQAFATRATKKFLRLMRSQARHGIEEGLNILIRSSAFTDDNIGTIERRYEFIGQAIVDKLRVYGVRANYSVIVDYEGGCDLFVYELLPGRKFLMDAK